MPRPLNDLIDRNPTDRQSLAISQGGTPGLGNGKGDFDICSNSLDSLVNMTPGALSTLLPPGIQSGVGRRSLGGRGDSRVIDQTARSPPTLGPDHRKEPRGRRDAKGPGHSLAS